MYEHKSPEDGYRILVERTWPRGVRREEGRIDLWMRKLAPSDLLTQWFSHNPKWDEFVKLYKEELNRKVELLKELKMIEKEKGVITLLYTSNDAEHNPAVVLKDMVERLEKEGEGEEEKQKQKEEEGETEGETAEE